MGGARLVGGDTDTHPWWENGEVEEEANVPLIEGKGAEFLDGSERGESFVDRYGDMLTAVSELLLDVVGLSITYVM